MIKGMLITKNSAEVISADDTLNVWYTLLNCSCIDIVSRKIGDKYYDIICDDEGLLKENPELRAMARNQKEVLVGSIFVCGLADDEGELTSLDVDDVRIIRRNLVYYNRKPILIYDI